MKEDFLLSSYNFDLPETQIAQFPSSKREESRLLVLHKKSGHLEHKRFSDIVNYIKKGDCIVINKTKVFSARLIGKKPTGGKIEFLLLSLPKKIDSNTYSTVALCKSSKGPKIGLTVSFGKDLTIKLIEKNKDGQVKIHLITPKDILDILEKYGEVPLPPYIRRNTTQEDKKRYQTVYANEPGSVAAPTAGLHFTKKLIKELESKGVIFAPVTLHVGYGTFSPIRSDDIRDHKIHSEWINISEKSATLIEQTKKNGGRVICIGTTSVRTVEFVYKKFNQLRPFSGPCDLYIYPGFDFKVTDAILTNFHLPKSSLLLLVSAFAGRTTILTAYKEAIKNGYRFFSYGDAMLIL